MLSEREWPLYALGAPTVMAYRLLACKQRPKWKYRPLGPPAVPDPHMRVTNFSPRQSSPGYLLHLTPARASSAPMR